MSSGIFIKLANFPVFPRGFPFAIELGSLVFLDFLLGGELGKSVAPRRSGTWGFISLLGDILSPLETWDSLCFDLR